MERAPVEQYLLFDHTAYLKGIENIGTIALSELIYGPEPVHEILPLQVDDVDHGSRLFEI